MENFNYIEQQRAFNRERKMVKQEYDDAVRALQAELHAKVMKLQAERDRKLDDIAHREDNYIRKYREWKQNNWMRDNNHRLDNPEPKQP